MTDTQTPTQQAFATQFPHIDVERNYSLATMSYFKIGGPAELYMASDNSEEIAAVVAWCTNTDTPLTVLGGASNVIISDSGIPGVVLHLTATSLTQQAATPEGKDVIAVGAGLKTALLVSQTVQLGYEGLEYFLGVPGTVGGAIYNNSHYLADLIGEHVHRVLVCTPTGELTWLSKDECAFGYDSSRFQTSHEIILEVEFALKKGDSTVSKEKIKEATIYRATTQPLGTPNSGCIFQNTPNNDDLRQRFPQFADRSHVPSGFLIDQAGLKGERVGDIVVSEKHAAFMINTGNGKSQDVLTLIEKVKQRVKELFKVELKEEVFFLPKKS